MRTAIRAIRVIRVTRALRAIRVISPACCEGQCKGAQEVRLFGLLRSQSPTNLITPAACGIASIR